MEKAWVFASTAVTVSLVDFADPALAGQPDVRERGVRLEVRDAHVGPVASVYSSPAMALQPAMVRVDLLESAPHRADRMHFHPDMAAGEPSDRVFDESMPQDPTGWLRDFLTDLGAWVSREDRTSIAAAAEEIAGEADRLLLLARQPWPDVVHDERGLAIG